MAEGSVIFLEVMKETENPGLKPSKPRMLLKVMLNL